MQWIKRCKQKRRMRFGLYEYQGSYGSFYYFLSEKDYSLVINKVATSTKYYARNAHVFLHRKQIYTRFAESYLSIQPMAGGKSIEVALIIPHWIDALVLYFS
jgi:hypothetical protein